MGNGSRRHVTVNRVFNEAVTAATTDKHRVTNTEWGASSHIHGYPSTLTGFFIYRFIRSKHKCNCMITGLFLLCYVDCMFG